MKRFLLSLVIATSLALTSCKFDDSGIWDKFGEVEESIRDHEQRITALEELCKQMNTNISSLQAIVTALQNNDYVTSVIPVQKDGVVIGYTITFTKSQPITIYHGTNGKDGVDGTNGEDGKDGYTPQIGVAQHTDSVYYWTIDGEWLLDDKGNKIKAVGSDGQNGSDGSDGKDGQDGTDGADGNTPRLKIENDYWYVSYDNGKTWEKLCKATGKDGEDGTNGSNGSDGKDGEDGATPLLKIENEYWYVSYDNGATWNQLGKAVGEDGSNGSNGANGKDGITPRLKIENDYWYVSYDDGSTWTELGKAKGDDGQDGANGQNGTNGQNGDSMFKSVTQDEDNVYFTLSDGTVIALPKCNKADVEKLLARIQSISYIPTHSDGKASMSRVFGVDNGCAVFDFQISPKDAVKDIAANWESILSMKGVKTQTRAVSFIEMPITAFEADEANGIISLTASGENLDISFYTESRGLNVALYISDGNNSVTSDFVPMVPTDVNKRIWYQTHDKQITEPYANTFGANIVSNVVVVPGEQYSAAQCVITFDGDVTMIGDCSFANCDNLIHLHIPSSATKIGTSAFAGSSIYDLSISADHNLTSIGNYAFQSCNMHSAFIPEGVKSVGDYAFQQSQIETIEIPNSLEAIGQYAFASCGSLYAISLSENIKLIGEGAFEGSNVNFVFCNSATPPAIGKNIFGWTEPAIYVPKMAESLYKNAADWSDYNDDIIGYDFEQTTTLNYTTTDGRIADIDLPMILISNTYSNGVGTVSFYGDGTVIPAGMFCGCYNLASVNIPSGVKTIGNSAFESCSYLSAVSIPNSVTTIGKYAFSGCSRLSEVVVPNGVTVINKGAFGDCRTLEKVTLPNNLTAIKDYAFKSCSYLTEITIPATVTSIGSEAFVNSGLKKVYCKPVTPPAITDLIFGPRYATSNLTVYVPTESVDLYNSTEYWWDYVNWGYDF